MRHLSVPSVETARVFITLRDAGWIPRGGRIIPHASDESRRLIPILDSTPHTATSNWPVVEVTPPSETPRSYRNQLESFIPPSTIEEFADYWPTRHEILGDIILVKIPEEVTSFTAEIGQAMLTQHPRIRLIMKDNGVTGEFRVRALTPIAERVKEIIQIEFESPPSCRTKVKESGYSLWTDPTKAYFSGRLSKEREDNLESCKILRKQLGRKLRVCDPYAGVGPALIPLLRTEGLVEVAWGSDLNPAAVELMQENLAMFENTEVSCCDALTLQTNPSLREKFDVVLINIPHSTLSHLPAVIPLLKKSSPTLLRGWVVVDENNISASEEEILSILPPNSELGFSIRRSYSATQFLCRFEVKMNH